MTNHDRLLLDGAMGTELRARGVEVLDHITSIWSAAALVDAPEAVTSVHRDYIEAGARVVTACNYAVTPTLLAREGMAHRVEELSVLAVDLDADRVLDYFRGKKVLEHYAQATMAVGLWESEEKVFKRVFPDKEASLLELGCGCGRISCGLERCLDGVLLDCCLHWSSRRSDGIYFDPSGEKGGCQD